INPKSGFDKLTVGTTCTDYSANWQQYMANTLAVGNENQTAMFRLQVSEGNTYKLLDGTQTRVDNAAAGGAVGMIIPQNFPAGVYEFSGVIAGTTYTITLTITNTAGWAPAA
ncbi:MAG: hypothetical protein RSC08_04820, partial [Oscillospiraceae bacterium]